MADARRRIRAVLYDFDGTLADTAGLIMLSFQHTIETHLGYRPSPEEWLSGFGPPLAVQIARYARSPEEAEAMRVTYVEFQDAHTDELVKPFPGTLETVAALHARGMRMAIVTSKLRAATLRGMEVCGLMQYIDEIVTPEHVTHPKPHPESVLRALERLQVGADEALIVGDSPHDVAAGHAAGVLTAAAVWGAFRREALEEERPDFVLEAPVELLPLLDALSTEVRGGDDYLKR